MFESAEERPTSLASESLKIGMEVFVRMVIATLTVEIFLHFNQSYLIYNTHFGFLLLMVIEIYNSFLSKSGHLFLLAALFQDVF